MIINHRLSVEVIKLRQQINTAFLQTKVTGLSS